MRAIIGVVGLGLAVSLTAACGRGEVKGPDAPMTTSAHITNNDVAINRITGARCERAVSCNSVGSGKTYETREACERELGHDKRADLRAEECPRGISEPDLNDCLHDIKSEKCDNPLDHISRLAACRKAKLCLDR